MTINEILDFPFDDQSIDGVIVKGIRSSTGCYGSPSTERNTIVDLKAAAEEEENKTWAGIYLRRGGNLIGRGARVLVGGGSCYSGLSSSYGATGFVRGGE